MWLWRVYVCCFCLECLESNNVSCSSLPELNLFHIRERTCVEYKMWKIIVPEYTKNVCIVLT